MIINTAAISESNDTIDLKSRLGYYSELATAMYLSKIIQDHGYHITSNSNYNSFAELYHEKTSELIRHGAPKSEIDRMDKSGKILAENIFDDIRTNGEDLAFLTFDIELTGDSAKGKSKADLVLTISKDTKEQIIDKIEVSLKAYKS